MTAYALYDQTYTPQSGISATGGVFEPLKGKNREIGIKKDWMNGKWNTTVSAYYITRNNIIVTDPSTNQQSQIGQTKSKGIEFDMKGEIVHGLNVVINYAYTDSYISADANKNYIGLPSPYRIKHLQNTWLNYKLPKGFAISGGYQLQAGREGRYPQDGDLHLANVFRLDGGLSWSNGHFNINGLVNNILDRYNYGSAWTRPTGLYAYVPYPPREFRLTIGYNF
jgi:iron complex outermembrane receptor protein